MKAILSILLVFFGLSSFAQVVNFSGGDTVVNSASVSMTYNLKNSFANFAIQVQATKVSGTVGGSCVLYGSLDGSFYNAIGADTLTLTNVASQSHIWNDAPAKYPYYKVTCTGSGTMAAIVDVDALGRK